MKSRRIQAVVVIAGLLLLGALATAWLAFERDLHAARERVASGSQVSTTRCGPIEFAAAERGPAVLLVHGAAARCFAAAQADAHACLLDHLGIERASIIGVSAGVPSTLQFALRHPQRTTSIALLVPLAWAPREVKPMPPATRFMLEKAVRSDLLYWAALNAAPSLVARTVLATPPEVLAAASAPEQARARKVMQNLLPLSERNHGLVNDWNIGMSITRYPLERITAPALVISLQDDLYGTFESARYTAVHIPGARFVGYESGGHAWVGHHAEIITELLAFLKGGALATEGHSP